MADQYLTAEYKNGSNRNFFFRCSQFVPFFIGIMDKIKAQLQAYERQARAGGPEASGATTTDTSLLYNINLQKQMYDNKFVEEQYNYQKTPKKRGQTLQEFVLLFFYISLAIFSIAIVIYAFLENGQSYAAAGQALLLCIVLTIAITAILIRVA